MADEYKVCDICKHRTNCEFDLLLFGDWQQCRDVVVHYFCLLLSTNLPQRGQDSGGINGFLLRDIRKEVAEASKRLCIYCGRAQASVQCYKCNEYFHIRCGRQNRCLHIFKDDFRSYCDECIPRKDLQPVGLNSRPSSFERCSICRNQMGLYDEVIFIFGKCCNKGYAHSVCVQKYALAAGYYLRCLWCRSEKFRDSVRQHGIFVPDRDARWEIQKETYQDLHRGHNTCNMEKCLCPNGRDFNKGKWSIILCSLCGSFGAHNPKCLLGKENAKVPLPIFKCTICAQTEEKVTNKEEQELNELNNKYRIDKTIFMTKNMVEKENVKDTGTHRFIPSFSEDDDTHSSDSVVTVITQKASGFTSDASSSSGEVNKELEEDGNNVIPIESTDSIEIDTEIDALAELLEATAPSTALEPLQEQHVIHIEDESTQVIPIENTENTGISTEIDDHTQVLEPPAPSEVDETPREHDIMNLEDKETQVLIPSRHETHKTPIAECETQDFDRTSPKNVTEATELHDESQNTTKAEASSTSGMSQEFSSLQNTKPLDYSNQSPVVTSSSQLEDDENWVTFDVYEYDEVKGKCKGSATIRINLNEARFAGMTLDHIEEHSSELITEADVISRSDDIGIFARIDAIIAEYI